MIEISIKSHFCGAHKLNGYKGPCANLHGHNWEVEIYLRGSKPNRLGMLVDFRQAKETLHALLAKLDHKNLNDLPFFQKVNPTSENIARLIFHELSPKFNSAHCRLQRVRVSETTGTSAVYTAR